MKRVKLKDITLAVYERGEGDPVVLLHGFPFSHKMWSPVVPSLESKYRVIVPDLRGFGGSDVTPRAVSMERMADDVAELLIALNVHGTIVLGGLSMGGYVAMEFMKKHASLVRGLMLCDTRTAPDAPDVAQGRLRLADTIDEPTRTELAEKMLPKLLCPSTLENDPETVETVRHMVVETDPHGIAAALRGMAERCDTTEMLKGVRCPTLVVVGENDICSPPQEMRGIADAIPQSMFVQIPWAGHLTPLEQPGEFSMAVCDFLRTL